MVSKQTLSRDHKQFLFIKIINLAIKLLLSNKNEIQTIHISRIKNIVLEMEQWLETNRSVAKFSDYYLKMLPKPESYQKRMEKLKIVD